MEKQKVFWVVLAVSILVVIVLITGVFLLRQKPAGAVASAPGTINPISEPGTQIYEYQRETTGAKPGAQGEQQVQHFYIGEGESAPPAAATPGAASGAHGTSGTQVTPQTPAARPPESPTAAQPPAAQPPAAQSPAARPSAARPKSIAPAAAPKAAPTRPPARKPAQTQRLVEYWIQTGSYKSQSKAEELAGTLEGKGLSARVFSYTSRGVTFYRVRIGPYASSGEAQKFLATVKNVQGLESSFVSQVHSTRALN